MEIIDTEVEKITTAIIRGICNHQQLAFHQHH